MQHYVEDKTGGFSNLRKVLCYLSGAEELSHQRAAMFLNAILLYILQA